MRPFLTLIACVTLLLGSFAIWGEYFDGLFNEESIVIQPGFRTAAFVILLLMSDVILPIPVTVILATLGMTYGAVVGGVIGTVGTFVAGSIAYFLCRLTNHRISGFLLGEKGVKQIKVVFQKHGGWAVALSRWMAILPELVSGCAGLVRMPARQYFPALICGVAPMSFTYAWIGSTKAMEKHTFTGMILSAIIPLFLWALVNSILRKKSA
ncbi:MAG: VTT domain-containing protein [Opitutae bacterium]|nr:VTT domain-containing protein [Opitutae bacterium]